MVSDKAIGDRGGGGGVEYNSISLHFCKLWQNVYIYFLFKRLDVRASENPSASQIFQSGLL